MRSFPRSRVGLPESGMTLVEVLLAMGILAGVLVSTASLFVLGGQRVKAGREMTQASTLAAHILEDLKNVGLRQAPELFPSCCIPSCDTSSGCTVSSVADPYAGARWQSQILAGLHQGKATLTLTPVGGSGQTPTFGSAEGIRIHVRIEWNAGGSERSLEMETLSF